jgi:IS4 transposase
MFNNFHDINSDINSRVIIFFAYVEYAMNNATLLKKDKVARKNFYDNLLKIPEYYINKIFMYCRKYNMDYPVYKWQKLYKKSFRITYLKDRLFG